MNCRYDWSDPLTSSMNFRDTREQILVFAIQLGYTLEDLFIRCEYKAQQRNCSDLFIAVTGSQGKTSNISFSSIRRYLERFRRANIDTVDLVSCDKHNPLICANYTICQLGLNSVGTNRRQFCNNLVRSRSRHFYSHISRLAECCTNEVQCLLGVCDCLTLSIRSS